MTQKQIIETAIESMVDSNLVDIETGVIPKIPFLQLVKVVTFSKDESIGIGMGLVPNIEGVVEQMKSQISSTGNKVVAISTIKYNMDSEIFETELFRYDNDVQPNRMSDVHFEQSTFSMN